VTIIKHTLYPKTNNKKRLRKKLPFFSSYARSSIFHPFQFWYEAILKFDDQPLYLVFMHTKEISSHPILTDLIFVVPQHKVLILTPPGVNFTNILLAAFTSADFKSVRTQSSCQYLFTLLGSTSVKAVRRTLIKLSHGVNFSNSYFAISFNELSCQSFLCFWDLHT